MLARIAHELFWLGRNLSRAEHTARMLDGIFQADIQARSEEAGMTLGWGSLLAIMGAETEEGVPPHRDQVLRSLTLDADNPASVISCIGRGREGARTVRDVISQEMWESINTTNLGMQEGDLSERLLVGPYSVYQYVKERSALFWGLTRRTMLRDEAYSFLQAGGRLESADMMLRMLRVALAASAGGRDDGHALSLLQAVGGFQAYRRAVPGPPNAAPVVRFLLFERAYPDSVAASVDLLEQSLSRADDNPRNAEPVLRLLRLTADLEFRRRAEEDTQSGNRLAEICGQVQTELGKVDRDVHDRYFAGAPAAA
ncbi:MAG: alpha-E domain-containing protein [Solirubrobacteraceae bacterium]|nr:alpha-E domain-containing protein [Solirubrobacteraceae bacterium]